MEKFYQFNAGIPSVENAELTAQIPADFLRYDYGVILAVAILNGAIFYTFGSYPCNEWGCSAEAELIF